MRTNPRKGLKLLVLPLILALIGCSNVPVTPTQTPVPPTEMRTPTHIPTPTSTATSTPTPMPSPIPVFTMQERCVQISVDPAPAMDRRVVLHSRKDGVSSYILDLKTGDHFPLGDTFSEAVSPDGSRLAYTDLDLDVIVISDGSKILEIIPDKSETLYVSYWLDDQRLVLERRRTDYGDLSLLFSLIVLNPFTGEQQEWIPEDYPDLNNLQYDHFHWAVDSRLMINSELTYLVYPSLENGNPIVLWDIINKHPVIKIYGGSIFITPWWSPDGNRFVVSAPVRISAEYGGYKNIDDGLLDHGGWELLLVNQTGEIKRLTYFSVYAKSYQDYYVEWAPDGDQIAFMEVTGTGDALSGAPQLMVVNIGSGDVMNYCITGDAPIWSADGKYILLTQIDEKKQHHVLLIDLQTAQAWEIAKDASAMGWMVPEP